MLLSALRLCKGQASKVSTPSIWGGHFRCPPRFCQYSCGFAGFWTENPENSFTVDVQGKIRSETPQARLPPDFSGRRPRFFAFCGPFPRCQMCRSLRLSNRQVDESPKRPKIKPSKYKGVVRPFSGTLRLAGRGVFCASPLSHSPP